MPQGLGANGGLPFPQSLYPVNLAGGELVANTNEVHLAPGQQLPIPRGTWWVNVGAYAVLQFFDPIRLAWIGFSSARCGPLKVDSDGFNFRVANLLGCALTAVVTNGGTSYVQSSTTVTPSTGNSTWQPIVGGRVNTTVSITASGAGYGVAPLCFIPPPAPPGVQATAVATISSGTVSSITITNVGAGYGTGTAPPITMYPNPTDPNLASNSITATATASLSLLGSGVMCAVICTNPGASFTTVPSLTIAGAGTSAAATIVPMWTLIGASITSGGAGFSANTQLATQGGIPSATAAFTNPQHELTGYIPRPASILATAASGVIATIQTIYDGGMFAGTPTPLIMTQTGAGGTTAATIALSLGSVNALVEIQPAL